MLFFLINNKSRFASIQPWCIRFIHLKCPPLCLNKNQCLLSLLVLACNIPHVSHSLPSPARAYRQEHCVTARGSCRQYFRVRCAVIFFFLLFNLFCVCTTLSVITWPSLPHGFVWTRSLMVFFFSRFFPHKTAMQLWLQDTLARATGHTTTLASKAPHQMVQSAKSYINIYTLFSCFVPQILMQKVSFSKGFCVILFQNFWLQVFSCSLLISFETTPSLVTGYYSWVALSASTPPEVCRINLWNFLLCRLRLSLSCLNPVLWFHVHLPPIVLLSCGAKTK